MIVRLSAPGVPRSGGEVRGNLASHPKVTAQKRMRERARQEWQKEKAARREEAKARKLTAPNRAGGEDPDSAGIVPGPQPSPWGDDLEPWGEAADEKEESAE